MNKSQLIEKIANETGMTKASAERAIDAFTGAVTETLAKGDTVSLVGFGAFSVKERASRVGRNPQTGEEIQISAAKVPTFKPGKSLKDACN